MARSERDELEQAALPAVLVRRSDLPVPLAHPSRSFFGGLPKLPPQFEWPTAEVRANETLETVALTFVAQIDLAELPGSGWSPLPKRGTLYFFCSSVFVGEGRPPCRVLYGPSDGGAYPDRAPPPNLMPLAGTDGDYQVKWLDPNFDFHSKVEFKYPISFRLFRDFYFREDAVGGELMVEELCKALGPGEPPESDLLQFRGAAKYEKDEDWPFNWLLITYVVRSVLSHVQRDLTRGYYGKPLTDEATMELKRLRAGAVGWLERCRALTQMDGIDLDTKASFRSWWFDVVRAYEKLDGQVRTYASELPRDLGNAINHTIRCMATQRADGCDDVPLSYVANLARQNHWKTPTVEEGQRRHFSTALHQMLGYGSGPQDATEEHLEDMLLLQIQGDLAFFDWHSDVGGVLHFWIDRDALARRDFSQVVATYECD
ncbi:DUF1963 domain-containing protein [Bradyrhizobium sp. 147]|uniref:DUF1963 domain-containing protein n=1 Tax=unclassified Bradyrhizobium TaxID=2631580 RepID=UPI001FF7BECD|nr:MULTISPECIES: DUF1963 domain-containing protein [unclassified Bradyrhizobium]MCK1544947.1 DUF1963 domain-containing protein [Bradyrhizobium sp. 179]MCK1628200.1 DUF1963 domain-containing protein [Bradyrhizobium sp. 160]MCK1681888.1 DUF1963 domain-containing protein [Bradyrhizobium sp. 147]